MPHPKIHHGIIFGIVSISLCFPTTAFAKGPQTTVPNLPINYKAQPAKWEHTGKYQMVAPIKHRRKIYYYIDPMDVNYHVVLDAVNNWNQLKVVKLVQTFDPDSYLTFRTDKHNFNHKTIAETNLESSGKLNKYHKETYQYAHVVINNPVIQESFNQAEQILTIEHEIGHALGFAHDKQVGYNTFTNPIQVVELVMNPEETDGDNIAQLGQIEQKALSNHYHLKPYGATNLSPSM